VYIPGIFGGNLSQKKNIHKRLCLENSKFDVRTYFNDRHERKDQR